MRYEDLKEFAAEIAEISADIADVDAKMVGYKDVYDLIMSDCDHPRHFHFLLAITDAFSSEERRSDEGEQSGGAVSLFPASLERGWTWPTSTKS